MGNSLLCHYIDNCFKEGIILWGQKHCDWGGKVEDWGACAPPVPMLKKALSELSRRACATGLFYYLLFYHKTSTSVDNR